MIPGLTSIIVVSADSGDCLLDCIHRALETSTRIELILVDNASRDGMPPRAAAMHGNDPRFNFLAGDSNIGFGPACNRAAAVARGDVLLFVNPDCLLDADTVQRLRDGLMQADANGIVGALVVDAREGGTTGASQRRDPTLRRSLLSLTGLSSLEGRWPALAGIEMPPLAPTDRRGLVAVDAISGACFAIRHALYRRLGGFDEAYFLHCEDLDLCRRARDAGYAVLSDPTTRVSHRQGSSSRHRAVFVARHKHRGMWLWFTRFDPAARNRLLRVLVWIGIWLHFGLFRLRQLIATALR